MILTPTFRPDGQKRQQRRWWQKQNAEHGRSMERLWKKTFVGFKEVLDNCPVTQEQSEWLCSSCTQQGWRNYDFATNLVVESKT